MEKCNANSFFPVTDDVMVPKESAQVQKHRFHNQDTTLNFESFYNSNIFRDKKKKRTKNTKTAQTWSLNYKEKASKDYIVVIHTILSQDKVVFFFIDGILVYSKWKIPFLTITNQVPTITQNNTQRKRGIFHWEQRVSLERTDLSTWDVLNFQQ